MNKERLDKIEAHFKKLQEAGKLSGAAILEVIVAVDTKAREEIKQEILEKINEI